MSSSPPADTPLLDVVTPVDDQQTRVSVWPVLLLAAPAGVAIWSGWVGLGELAGFGMVQPLPGIVDFELNTAITLPIGMECYAAYALRVWLSGAMPGGARTFARRSAIGALLLGALGQVAYHLLAAADVTSAPWPVTALVACLPVVVLGMGAALAHLVRAEHRDRDVAETELGDAQAVRAAAERELQDAGRARSAAAEARQVATAELAAEERARGELITRPHVPPSHERPARRASVTRIDARHRSTAAARHTWIAEQLDAGLDVTGADVKQQFPDARNGARDVSTVLNRRTAREA